MWSKNEKEQQPGQRKIQLKRRQSDSADLTSLKTQLKELNREVKERQDQLMGMSRKCREEGLRNQRLKKQVAQADERIQFYIKKQTEFMLSKQKNNKESPLFYNENGLSPMELLRIGEKKYEDIQLSNICMVCFMDLQKGVKVMNLPCSHIVHKQCGIQHFLYSRNCPACSQDIKNF